MTIESVHLRKAIRESVGFGAGIAYVGMVSVGETWNYIIAQGRRMTYALKGIPTRLRETSTPEGLGNVGFDVEIVQRQ